MDILKQIHKIEKNSEVVKYFKTKYCMLSSGDIAYLIKNNLEVLPTIEAYVLEKNKNNFKDRKIASTVYNFKQQDNKSIIKSISIIKPSYFGQGVGSYLIKSLEIDCYENNHPLVDGQYAPHTIPEYLVEKFYKRNGYNFYTSEGNITRFQKLITPDCYHENINNIQNINKHKVFLPLNSLNNQLER